MVDPASPSPAFTTGKPPRPRRRIPLSLRMLGAILLLLGIFSALWVGVPAYRQHAALQELNQVPGILYESEKCGPAWLRKSVGDEWMAVIDDVVAVSFLGHGTDAEMLHVSRLTHLRVLMLEDTQVTDKGLAHLRSLPELEVLELRVMPLITDAGLEHLSCLKKLEVLNLEATPITDSGIKHLKGLQSLHTLDISQTQITDAGVTELKRALPNARIISGDGAIFF